MFFTTDLLCLHEKFQVSQSSPSGFFVKKCHIFNHICGENIFLPKYLRFYTSQKKNYPIGIKIEQKQGLYFSKLLKSLMLWIATGGKVFQTFCSYRVAWTWTEMCLSEWCFLTSQNIVTAYKHKCFHSIIIQPVLFCPSDQWPSEGRWYAPHQHQSASISNNQ